MSRVTVTLTAKNAITSAALVIRAVQAARGWSRDIAEMNIGGEFKDALTEPGTWSMGMGGFGETLPYHENTVTLDKTVKDKWGLPVLAFNADNQG